jgi:serine/threonine protein kinase/tetratricopeptide (TPR) repeat protein
VREINANGALLCERIETMSEQSLFIAALERDPSERGAFLASACAGNASLRGRVEKLLLAHEHAAKFMEEPAAPHADTIDEPVTELPGTMIGPYKLLQQIGEGGMGTVYMAEQTHPVQRKVALKLIKAGMDTRQVIARFEAERQALALMDHPNIAKVLDAGTTDSPLAPVLGGEGSGARGRPYFVMELVKGVSITKYCDGHHLTPKERLELFVPVCQAVQHAHQKGIIHRDLKPSNVLIALYDGKPVPKVIDFGVAKAMGQKLTEETLFTQFGQVVGTLEYMSPEQAEPNQLDIDTRSDIYSLGVLLYELLTGTTPIQRKRLKEAAVLEALRIIREEEPPKPSTRLSTTEELPSIAANRGSEPKKLSGLVRGELDWVVMKALEKDRNRRYETASAFAADVQRYLNDEPVLACSPSAPYRLRKFARRHRRALTVAGTFTAALVIAAVGLAVSTILTSRAYRAERLAHEQAKVDFQRALDAVELMLTEVGQEQLADVPQMEQVRRKLLEDALSFYRQFLKERGAEPALRLGTGRAYRVVADIYKMLSENDKAEEHYQQAQQILEKLADEDPASAEYGHQLATAHQRRASLLYELGRFPEADQAYLAALDRWTHLVADAPGGALYRRELANCHLEQGIVLERLGRSPEDEKAYHEAQEILAGLVADFPDVDDYRYLLAVVHYALGKMAVLRGRFQDAEKPAQQALELLNGLLKNSPYVLRYRWNQAKTLTLLGATFMYTDRQTKAIGAFVQACNSSAKLAVDFPSVPNYRYSLAAAHHNLGQLYSEKGRLHEAEEEFRLSIQISEKLAAEYPSIVGYRRDQANSYWCLGAELSETNQFQEAVRILSRALSLYGRLASEMPTVPEYQLQLAAVHSSLVEPENRLKNYQEADQHYRHSVDILTALLAKFPGVAFYRRDLANSYREQGLVLGHRGQPEQAQKAYAQGLKLWQGLVEEFPAVVEYRIGLARTWANSGDHVKAASVVPEIARLAPEPSLGSYHAAQILSLCAASATKDFHQPEPSRSELAQAYGARAVARLKEALEGGYQGIELLQKHRDFEPLRSRSDFKKLLSGYEKPP